MHHEDAGVERVAWSGELHAVAVQEDLAFVRPIEAGEDILERALPRAVLSEQRVHLARGCLEVDVVVCDNTGKPLRDPAHRDRGRRRDTVRAPPLFHSRSH